MLEAMNLELAESKELWLKLEQLGEALLGARMPLLVYRATQQCGQHWGRNPTMEQSWTRELCVADEDNWKPEEKSFAPLIQRQSPLYVWQNYFYNSLKGFLCKW